MPTDAEKLAIAEEKLQIAKEMFFSHKERCPYVSKVRGVAVELMRPNQYQCYGVEHADPIECAYLGLQKLAAEREAARTPEERRLRAALEDVLRQSLWSEAFRIARKALEQGA